MPTESRFLRRLTEGFAAFARRLRRDERGAIAVQFALLALPLAVLVFGLVDISRVSLQRRQMQDALDAATLIAARSTAVTDVDLDSIGDAAFAAEISGLNLGLSSASSTFKSGTNNRVLGTATGVIKPIIANLWTNANITVTANSEVVRSVNKLEVALVLDNTGSMDNDLGSGGKKITALIDASKSLVDVLSAAAARASETDAVKIAVVPFSMTVNIGSTYKTSSWMTGSLPSEYGSDLFNDGARPDRFTLLSNMGLSWTGCVESRPSPYDTTDDAPNSSVPGTMFVPFFAADEPDSSYSKYRYSSGYQTDKYSNKPANDYLRDYGGNPNPYPTPTDWWTRQGVVTKYISANLRSGASAFDAGPNDGCGITNVLRLTNVRTTANANVVKAKLDQMVASGNTNVAMGAVWGWHMISPNAPFRDGAAYGAPKTQKIIVLLTDGDNVMSGNSNKNNSTYSGYGYVWQKRLKNASNVSLDAGSSNDARRDAIDSRQTKICDNLRDKKILVYSIGVGVSTHSKSILQGCATTTDMYYDVTDASQLTTVFNAIAGSIQNLRIAK